MIFGFLVAVAYWPGINSAAIAPRWAIIAIGCPLLSLLDPRSLRAPTIGIVALGGLSVFWASDHFTALEQLIRLLIITEAMLLSANLDDITPVLKGFFWGMALNGALVIAQWLGYHPVMEGTPPAGLFWNRDFFAEAAAPILVWATASNAWRMIWALPLIAFPISLSGSRVACLAFFAGIAARKPKTTCLVGMFVFTAYSLWYPDKIQNALQRFTVWRDAVGEPSLFGQGIGSFTAAFPVWEYAHSDLLQSHYELGALGLGCYLGLLAIAFSAPASAALRATLVALAVEMAVASPLHFPATAFLFAMVAGHLVGVRGAVRGVRSEDGTGRASSERVIVGDAVRIDDVPFPRRDHALSVRP